MATIKCYVQYVLFGSVFPFGKIIMSTEWVAFEIHFIWVERFIFNFARFSCDFWGSRTNTSTTTAAAAAAASQAPVAA